MAQDIVEQAVTRATCGTAAARVENAMDQALFAGRYPRPVSFSSQASMNTALHAPRARRFSVFHVARLGHAQAQFADASHHHGGAAPRDRLLQRSIGHQLEAYVLLASLYAQLAVASYERPSRPELVPGTDAA